MRYFFLCFLLCGNLVAMEISHKEAESIGKGIFFNECSSKKDRLVWWNVGENFPSLGIGHFIWYPKDTKGPFEETFPALLAFFKENHVEIPGWLLDGCPWDSRDAFLDSAQNAKKKELQDLLSRTISMQATFIANRFENVLPEILASMDDKTRELALKKVYYLKKTSQGKFALIDYLNFKGAGLMEAERYADKGWGLKQVLEEMPLNSEHILREFVETAKRLLKERVSNAPQGRNEERWLPGWLSRVERYLKS